MKLVEDLFQLLEQLEVVEKELRDDLKISINYDATFDSYVSMFSSMDVKYDLPSDIESLYMSYKYGKGDQKISQAIERIKEKWTKKVDDLHKAYAQAVRLIILGYVNDIVKEVKK